MSDRKGTSTWQSDIRRIRLAKDAEARESYTKCEQCWKPIHSCLCEQLTNIRTQAPPLEIDIIIYLSLREYRCAGNSGRLLHLLYPEATSCVIFGDAEDEIRLIQKAKSAPQCCILFPSDDALFLSDWLDLLSPECKGVSPRGDPMCDSSKKRPAIILLDASWRCARHMVSYLHRVLPGLPCVSLTHSGEPLRSKFHRKQSQLGRICTLEVGGTLPTGLVYPRLFVAKHSHTY